MVIIRKATIKDAESIAACLLLAMEEIIYHFMGRESEVEAKAFLSYLANRDGNQYSYQNCWVAEVDAEVVAAVTVYDGARLNELRQPVIDYIRSRYRQDFQPEDETAAGEYYIDSLGVRPDRQGEGIGSKVLRFLIDEYAIKQGQTLGLLVDEENPDAKRLYLKLGFKSAGRKMLFGKHLEHLQFKV